MLERWCGRQVTAHRTAFAEKALPECHRRSLELMPRERTAYRHVRLVADGQILCEADNWYVPERLSAAMNDALERTNRPFGKVIAPLHPSRRVLSTKVLQGVGQRPSLMANDGGSHPALEHEALVMDGVGRALCIVHEIYMTKLLEVITGRYS